MRICEKASLSLAFIALLAVPALGQSLTIGSVSAVAGATVEIPVSVTVSEDLVGLHLRLKYDPDVLLSPRVEKGALLNEDHLVEYASPKEGELNIVAYSKPGGPPFNGHVGTVLLIRMTLSDLASAGSHAIEFATPSVVDSLTLPPSGLCGVSGDPIDHTLASGAVRIEGLSDGDLDGDGELTGLDLLVFSLWWRAIPDSTNAPANVVQTAPTDLVEVRDLLGLLHLWRDSSKSGR
ncbi:MAG: hypothetical protein KC944_10235 [Candidatus Omnitrophica bacterium]|nr:hypothetical protein [Candidatus Omnitrophota bacterium]